MDLRKNALNSIEKSKKMAINVEKERLKIDAKRLEIKSEGKKLEREAMLKIEEEKLKWEKEKFEKEQEFKFKSIYNNTKCTCTWEDVVWRSCIPEILKYDDRFFLELQKFEKE